jgi:hypothetical protein
LFYAGTTIVHITTPLQKISKAEFMARVTFQKLEAVLGKERIKKYKDMDGNGQIDMADIWTAMDTDLSGDISVRFSSLAPVACNAQYLAPASGR